MSGFIKINNDLPLWISSKGFFFLLIDELFLLYEKKTIPKNLEDWFFQVRKVGLTSFHLEELSSEDFSSFVKKVSCFYADFLARGKESTTPFPANPDRHEQYKEWLEELIELLKADPRYDDTMVTKG